MKFELNVILEFKAGSLREAGDKVNMLVEQAAADHDMEARVVNLRTPPAEASPPPTVILPPVSSHDPRPGPHAQHLATGP